METSDFLREKKEGKFSALRLLLILWGIVVLGVWTYLSIKSAQMQTVDMSIVGILASLGLTKTAQRFAENKEN